MRALPLLVAFSVGPWPLASAQTPPPAAAAPAASVPAAADPAADPAADTDTDAVDDAAIAFFLEEGLQRSQVMEHLSWLCDVYGPRVTGSPNLRKAQAWAQQAFAAMGCEARTEAWGPFGRGWRCEHVAMGVVGDNPWPVIAYPKAWSPSLPGRVEADVVHVAALDQKALEALDLTGKVVLVDDVRDVREPFDGYSKRLEDKDLSRLADQRREDAQPSGERAATARSENDFRLGFQKREQMLAIVQKKRPLAIVDRGSKGDYGTVFVQGGSAVTAPGTPREQRPSARDRGADVIPQFTIAVEHYNRMCRVLAKGLPVRVAVELRTTYFEDDLNDQNVLADLRGGDAAIGDEVAMIGAHLDSWQAGTGSTDNGCGSAVVIEAMRLVTAWCQKQGVRPRRTVRASLWSGEEQGLLGSRAWVAQHLGTADDRKPEHARIAGYFNLDNGTGRIRGVYLQGNEAVARPFRRWLVPFHAHGASTLTLDDTGGTDHLAFHAVGVPGFQFLQDPVSYSTRTHHSNMDVWDHAVADDLKQASVVMAAFVWQTAQRDAQLPRHVPPPPRRPRSEGAPAIR
ncbi:MAG: M28 family peptidase [Planctomycetota bacterium]